MKKKLIFAVLVSFLICGVVSAGTQWGAYKGNAIVRITVGGTVFKPAGSPAQIVNGQAMIPLTALDKAGIKYTFDKGQQTVDIKQQDDTVSQFVRSTGLYVQMVSTGSAVEASTSFQKRVSETADWDAILNQFKQMSRLDADSLRIDYYDAANWLGNVIVDRKAIQDFQAGKITDQELSPKFKVNGKLFRQPLTTQDIGKLKNSVGVVTTYDANGKPLALGSGFVINKDMFITNDHVVQGAAKIIVKLDGVEYDVSQWMYFVNKDTDLYCMRLSTSYDSKGFMTGSSPVHYLDYSVDLPEVGEKVYAIGSPQGLENTLSEGIVSSIRTIGGMTYIQHTANTDHGSSGGVLLNQYGDVIGVTSMGIDGTSLDFAIPMKYVQQDLDKLKN